MKLPKRFNVNSLKVRLPQTLDWLAQHQPDVLCLQETKLQDENFPLHEIHAAGYQAIYAGQKTYNGVALLSRQAGAAVVTALPHFVDVQKRVVAATYGDVRVICIYVPNGESLESEKFLYKLSWLEALTEWLREELQRYPKLALLGDFNIAPDERDVHDAKAWEGKILFSPSEHQALQKIMALGLRDSFRLFDQAENSYTWWDYRMLAFRRNMGLRIDHILLSAPLAEVCTACCIDRQTRKLERPSDHAPVWVALQS